METKPTAAKSKLTISPPNFKTAICEITGNAPYVSNKFTQEAKEMMRAKQALGMKAQKGQKREPKDFAAIAEQSAHTMNGNYGIPCISFRAALVSACRLVNFKMTLAKMALFILPDGYSDDEQKPLVTITGEHEHCEHAVRNESGVADIRPRMMWKAGWTATVRVQYDADLFSETDVRNLLLRAGLQVGVGAGRPDSTASVGQGWGTFELK